MTIDSMFDTEANCRYFILFGGSAANVPEFDSYRSYIKQVQTQSLSMSHNITMTLCPILSIMALLMLYKFEAEQVFRRS